MQMNNQHSDGVTEYSFEQISEYYFVLKRCDEKPKLIEDASVWAATNIKNHYKRELMLNRFECVYYGECWHFSYKEDALLFKLRWG
jgi:hypothetical protein